MPVQAKLQTTRRMHGTRLEIHDRGRSTQRPDCVQPAAKEQARAFDFVFRKRRHKTAFSLELLEGAHIALDLLWNRFAVERALAGQLHGVTFNGVIRMQYLAVVGRLVFT